MDKKRSEKSTPSGKPLQEGVDFFIEQGLYVFTEKFLRERGFCCKSGCRHCPYGYTNSGNLNNRNSQEDT